MSEPLLVLDRVAKRFGSITAVREVDIEISEGEFVAIMGPSGCGKTTTLRMIAGLETPSDGEIRLRGRRMNEVKPWDRDTPLVWQSLALFPFMSVVKNVEFGLRMRGIGSSERRQRALNWLERLGIGSHRDRKVDRLSGGERQRVALARALVTEPEILLLDEPLSALDAHLVVRMQSELSQLQDQLGITFCYVTHNQSEAFAMADRVVIMSDGQVQQVGSPRVVYRAPANRFVADFVGANNVIAGTVRGLEDDRTMVDTGFGTLAAPASKVGTLKVGDTVDLVVSADRISLSTTGGGDENRIRGTLISEQFVGAVVTLYLDTGGESEFRVQLQQHEADALEMSRGVSLIAGWRAEHTYILPGERKGNVR
ncbi:MAG: ABC transporter ATP-binding protein [Alphaproteobacteria bacterium]|nr:ABC transporter ATP-binding protein [Alphaproteobacteria bacterium]